MIAARGNRGFGLVEYLVVAVAVAIVVAGLLVYSARNAEPANVSGETAGIPPTALGAHNSGHNVEAPVPANRECEPSSPRVPAHGSGA